MTSPDTTKTLRVSAETHAQVMAHARRLRATVDETVADLADESTIRLLVSDKQRSRWERAAKERGLRLGDFVRLLVEAGITYNPRTLDQVFYRVDALVKSAGITPQSTPTIPD